MERRDVRFRSNRAEVNALSMGRAGHFGLRGMRERAQLMGGKLTVWSELESGTEVELSISASRAYATSPSSRRSWFAEKFFRKDTEDTS